MRETVKPWKDGTDITHRKDESPYELHGIN
jgi:hypothetical protein